MAAGLWVKVAATLPRHYKTESLARALSLPTHEVVGKLVSLWIYAVEFANTGLLTADDIRRGFFSADEPQDDEAVRTVIQALVNAGMPHHAGFLEPMTLDNGDGSYDETTQTWALHDWCDYSGTYQPGMTYGENGERSLSYKKRKKRREEITQEETLAAHDVTGRPAENQKPLQEEKPAVMISNPPPVSAPLLMSKGENFAAVRAALDAQFQDLARAMERRGAAVNRGQ